MQKKPTEQNCLQTRANGLCASTAFRDVIARHMGLPLESPLGSQVNLAIHPNDQMLDHSLRRFREAGPAVSQYFGVALEQHRAAEQILKTFFPDLAGVSILDFACGYGRMLRFLAHAIPPTQIWASDIQREAVDFVSPQFGVNGIYSDANPSQFDPGRKFDFIWVASLFSHLPASLFDAWLSKLSALLSPRGVLCFSVHDECLLPPGRPMPGTGILFAPESENSELDRHAYGTTHVSEAFVGQAIERAFGKLHPHFRIKRGLAYQQDIYVVAKDPLRSLTALGSFRWGPWGWVDVRHILASGALQFSGWATSFDEGGIDFVSISFDGAIYRCRTDVERRDAEAAFQDSRLRWSGWELSHERSLGGDVPFVEITAMARNGEQALLYAGLVMETED